MIKRLAAALLALGMAAPASAVVPPAPVLPFVPRACTPDPAPLAIARPASCQRILYRYGPLHVTPGDNLILFGPVSVERPLGDGYIARFKPDMTYVDGTVPPIDIIHLHHAVWMLDLEPTFASGEEKTMFSMPEGYGMPVGMYQSFVLNYMLHNQTPLSYNVFITYEIDWIPAGSAQVISVQPHWLDVGAHNGFNPIYNTQMGYGSGGECAYPRQRCADFDPYGSRSQQAVGGNGDGDVTGIPAGTIVWMMGHLHPGGLRDEVSIRRGTRTVPLFTSHAVYFDPGGPLSWDLAMEVTPPDFRARVLPGDRLVLNSVYDTAHGSWYEGMGIVITFIAEGSDQGKDPFVTPFDPDAGVLTHGHLAEANNHGGPDGAGLNPARRIDTSRVQIAGFAYLPGDQSTLTGPASSIPVVKRGTPLVFDNYDGAASIFHTVTACASPCNGPTGISYPLANGTVDFDSLELGLGPPGVTAASNKLEWSLPTGALTPGLYSYFCRVHPFMRGAFEIS